MTGRDEVVESALASKIGPLLLRFALALPCIGDGYQKIYQMGGTSWAGPGLSPAWQAVIVWVHLLSAMAILVGIRTRWASGILLACLISETWLLRSWPGIDQIWPSTHKNIIIWFLAGGMTGVAGGEWKLDLQANSK